MFNKLRALSLGKKAFWTLGILLAAGTVANAGSNPKPPAQTPNKPPTVVEPTKPDVKSDKIETKDVIETELIPYSSSNQNDATLASGTTTVKVVGVTGQKTKTYTVTYKNDVETSRVLKSEVVTIQPTNEVIAVGTYVKPVYTAPVSNYSGATAICRDGTYSYSAHRSGTCSHHGGVAEWL